VSLQFVLVFFYTEDPFQGSLRLSILCDAIRRNVISQTEDMKNSAYILDDVDSSLTLARSPGDSNRINLEELPTDENLFSSIRFVNGVAGTTSDLGI
jgi:hypothetical protein